MGIFQPMCPVAIVHEFRDYRSVIQGFVRLTGAHEEARFWWLQFRACFIYRTAIDARSRFVICPVVRSDSIGV